MPLAAIGFVIFLLAAGGTLRLAIAEAAWRMQRAPAAEWALRVENATYYRQRADQRPELAIENWQAAVRLNPRDSASWIALGLEAERRGDMDQAAHDLSLAEDVDHQFLPAWTSANFWFRRGNDRQFWRAIAHAAALSYDDPSPLIALADHRNPGAPLLERLGDTSRLERSYLRYLMEGHRWQEAETVAARLSTRKNAGDRELLLTFTDRLIDANQADAALASWNGIPGLGNREAARSGYLVNGGFQQQPSGHGFDWHVTEPASGQAHWKPARMQFRLSASTPEISVLLEQCVVLKNGRYSLGFTYRTEGLAGKTGLRWVLLDNGGLQRDARLPINTSPMLEQARNPGAGGRRLYWNFKVPKAGIYRLQLIYIRVPGTLHTEGLAEFASVGLEAYDS